MAPVRRTPLWIAFGKPIFRNAGLPKPDLRKQMERDFAHALTDLYRQLRETFSLTRKRSARFAEFEDVGVKS